MNNTYNLQKKGSVYILKNPAYNLDNKPIIKIGRTGKEDPNERIESMNKETPVPMPFQTVSITETPANSQLEKYAHDCLAEERISNTKEFFTTSEEKAKNVVKAINEDINKKSYVIPNLYNPLSDKDKKKLEKSGYAVTESSDYSPTPFSDAKYCPDENDPPENIDKSIWQNVCKKNK